MKFSQKKIRGRFANPAGILNRFGFANLMEASEGWIKSWSRQSWRSQKMEQTKLELPEVGADSSELS
jgi:hypothetical protein